MDCIRTGENLTFTTIPAKNILASKNMSVAIRSCEPLRVVEKLSNGNLAILQIVDPDDVPSYVKWIRKRKGKVIRVISSFEAAFRVGRIVFKNSMRKERKIEK